MEDKDIEQQVYDLLKKAEPEKRRSLAGLHMLGLFLVLENQRGCILKINYSEIKSAGCYADPSNYCYASGEVSFCHIPIMAE